MDLADRALSLRNRARSCARKQDYRKAALALRELTAHVDDAATWTQLGVALLRARRRDEAVEALRRAVWMHQREGGSRRAAVVRQMLAAVESGETPLPFVA